MENIFEQLTSNINGVFGEFIAFYLVFKFFSLVILCLIIRNSVWQGTKMAIRDILNEYEFVHDVIIDKDSNNIEKNT